MTRRPFVVANWKMNHARALARAWCATFREAHAAHPWPEEIEVGVAPPYTSLDTVVEGLAGLPVRVGAQNVHQEPKGAFTGEIAAGMLAETGCSFVIIGHSERRHGMGESDERIAQKVHAARDAGITPLLCVGETEHQRDEGRTEVVIENQLRHGLSVWKPGAQDELILAYEPVWAIGTGKVATAAQAQEAQGFLRSVLGAIAGPDAAARTRILYGGSVTPSNAPELAALPDVDGFLVGGASLEALSFQKIVLAGASD